MSGLLETAPGISIYFRSCLDATLIRSCSKNLAMERDYRNVSTPSDRAPIVGCKGIKRVISSDLEVDNLIDAREKKDTGSMVMILISGSEIFALPFFCSLCWYACLLFLSFFLLKVFLSDLSYFLCGDVKILIVILLVVFEIENKN